MVDGLRKQKVKCEDLHKIANHVASSKGWGWKKAKEKSFLHAKNDAQILKCIFMYASHIHCYIQLIQVIISFVQINSSWL